MKGKKFNKIGKLVIKIVDGTRIRNLLDVGFVFGGHDKAYDYIPKNQIWIEKSIPVKERKHILMHEFAERDLMKHGMGYGKAHMIANQIENFQRKIGRVI
jgi:hypothetical protein